MVDVDPIALDGDQLTPLTLHTGGAHWFRFSSRAARTLFIKVELIDRAGPAGRGNFHSGLPLLRQPTLSGSSPPWTAADPAGRHGQSFEAGRSFEAVRHREQCRLRHCLAEGTGLAGAIGSGRFSGSFFCFTRGGWRQSPDLNQRLAGRFATVAAFPPLPCRLRWSSCSGLPQGSLGLGRRLAERGNGPQRFPLGLLALTAARIRPTWSPTEHLGSFHTVRITSSRPSAHGKRLPGWCRLSRSCRDERNGPLSGFAGFVQKAAAHPGSTVILGRSGAIEQPRSHSPGNRCALAQSRILRGGAR